LHLVANCALAVTLRVEEHVADLHKLPQKYRETPMPLADACVLRMAELHEHHAVTTLDSGFTVYRKHGRTPLALVHPGED
jgi:predicted nucleic acid-binding protein